MSATLPPAVPAQATEAGQRAAVAREAGRWLGTPYHHHARIQGVGVDCAQLLCAVFEACGLVPPIVTGFYPRDWHLHRGEQVFSAWLAKHARLVGVGSCAQALFEGDTPPQQGDVLLFQFGRAFSHGCIVVSPIAEIPPVLVHAYLGRGVILSRPDEEPLARRSVQHWSLWPRQPGSA